MTKQRLAGLSAAFFAVWIPTLFWIGGYDFTTRGETGVLCSLLTTFLAVGSYTVVRTYPGDF